MALQISLSNPLTVAVSFVVQTRGPFAINPSPTKKRLRAGAADNSRGDNSAGGMSTVLCQGVSPAPGGSGGNLANHQWTSAAATTGAAAEAGRTAAETTAAGTAPAYTTPQSSRHQQQHSPTEKIKNENATADTSTVSRRRGVALGHKGGQSQHGRCSGSGGTTGRNRGGRGAALASQRTVKLLPGQNYQMELVFLPARASAEMAQALQSSFCPGSEVSAMIPSYSIPPLAFLSRLRVGYDSRSHPIHRLPCCCGVTLPGRCHQVCPARIQTGVCLLCKPLTAL